MPASPRAPLALLPFALLLLAGCDLAGERHARDADDRFARAYIHALHDSGVVAVLGRTKRESAALPAFAVGVDAMRLMLPAGAIDTVQLERAVALPGSARGAGSELVYLVRGGGGAAEVRIVVEREEGRPVVERISVARRGG